MSQIARRRRKGRPSKADLAQRGSSSPVESGYELRRGQRRRNVRYNFDFLDFLDEEEEVDEDEDEEEERTRQKKLKQVLKLNQSRARADPPNRSGGRAAVRVSHASDYEGEEEEEDDDDEAEGEEENGYDDEEDASEKRQVKKRKINRHEEQEENDYDEEEEEEEEEDQADSEEDDDNKERKRRSASSLGGTQCDHSSETTPILDKKPLELILDKLQKYTTRILN